MNAQDMLEAARLVRVRELQTALAKAAEENRLLRAENDMLRAHFDLALLAAGDLAALPPGGKLLIIDGWNFILGSQKEAHTRAELVRQAQDYCAAHPLDFVWIVLDGPHASAYVDGRVRVSYTGGRGAHRADRLICDFLKMARLKGNLKQIEVQTNDKEFRKEVKRICAR